MDPVSQIFSAVGGSDEPFVRLVDEFYTRVEQDALLRPLYPDDLQEPKRKLYLFLIQRCGGKTTYSDERGHPRMRMRHMPFPIGIPERDAWLRNMGAAMDSVPEFAAQRETLDAYFVEFATFLMNKA
ncbi:MAG: globin [Candidatus Obscuribacterales bacterium]